MRRPENRTEFWIHIEDLHLWTAKTIDEARAMVKDLVSERIDPNTLTIVEVTHRVVEGAARTVAVLLTMALMWAMLGACAMHSRHTGPVPPGCTVTACGDLCCNDDGVPCPPCWVDISPEVGS